MSSPDSLHFHDITPSLSSVESLRSSLPQEYQPLFDTLRKEVMDFCDLHHIPTSSLHNDEALREATKHLSLPDLAHLSLVLKRLDYLVTHKEPMPEAETTDPLEYAEKHYHLREQYTSQVSLLEQVGILKDGHIEAIDGHRYPVPTLEQIALRLFERREELASKHDQGFTKLLLIPFGMSLDTLRETLKRFLLDYKKKYPDFELLIGEPLWTLDGYRGADTKIGPDGSPILIYHPTSFDENHQGKSKAQILEEQSTDPSSFPGWTIHLFQPSNPQDPNSPGIAPIPREGEGETHGQDREDIEANQTPKEYLSLLQSSKDNPDFPYSHETGLTPEDWILAFMTHLQETGRPLDDAYNPTDQESYCLLTGSFFPFFNLVSGVCWDRGVPWAYLGGDSFGNRRGNVGSRFSVIV